MQEEKNHEDNEELIAAISRIAIPGSAAHKRRRSEITQSVKTLDQLIEALNRGLQFKKIIFAPPSLFQKWKYKRRKTTCNNSTSKVDFGQEFEKSKSSVHKICYQRFGRMFPFSRR